MPRFWRPGKYKNNHIKSFQQPEWTKWHVRNYIKATIRDNILLKFSFDLNCERAPIVPRWDTNAPVVHISEIMPHIETAP